MTLDPVVLGPWLELLRDVGSRLTGPLASIFKDTQSVRDRARRWPPASSLITPATNRRLLADVLMAAEPKSFLKLFPVAELRAEQAVPSFRPRLAKSLTSDGGESEPAKDRLAERQARAAIALVRLGKAE